MYAFTRLYDIKIKFSLSVGVLKKKINYLFPRKLDHHKNSFFDRLLSAQHTVSKWSSNNKNNNIHNNQYETACEDC